MIVICKFCGRHVEYFDESIDFNDFGHGFIMCPFCESDNVEVPDFVGG